ncbi:MAG TPA: PAS domain-containing protein, partial [Planctomycetaceae bacterium]|nr:PAS domain-containing protein [Planctomycetaceae bacterium]
RPRSSTTALRNVLDQSQLPIYVLDDKRLVIYCNNACARWTGVETEDLIGTRCDYHTQHAGDPVQELAASLCPPPEVFSGKRLTAEIRVPQQAGQQQTSRQADCIPLGIDSLDDAGVVVIVNGQSEPAPMAAGAGSELNAEALHRQLAIARNELTLPYQLDRLIGESPLMRRVQQQVRLAIKQPAHVVVTGPPGSGREHVARTIHANHTSKPTTLIPVACPLVNVESMQSTVTSFVKHCQQEQTSSISSLLLLDVDQLSPEAQHELSGFFAIPSFQMLTIATSDDCLLSLAKEGQFNKTLAYALSTLVIELPPLSDRDTDIALLAQSILEDLNAEGNRQFSGFSDEAMDRLMHHTWSRHVDELVEIVRVSCQESESSTIQEADLPDFIQRTIQAESRPRKESERIDLDKFLAEVENELIDRALTEAKGNKTRASQLLGITRSRLHRRLQQDRSPEPDKQE